MSLATLLFLILLCLLVLSTGGTSVDLARADLIETNQQQGRLMQALYQVSVAADRQGWTPELLRLAGDLWYAAGNVTRALPYWEAASPQLPDDVLLRRRLAEAYLAMQRWPEAVDQLVWLGEQDPDDAWAQFHLGALRAAFDPQAAQVHLQAAAGTSQYRTAAGALLRVIRDHAADPLIGMPVGLALAEAEMWPYAELAFRHAADVGQAYAEALAYVGLARDRQGKDGREWVNRAVGLEPQNAVVRFVQGVHLRAQDDLTGSLDALVLAAALDPANPAYYAELGTAYWLVDDLENAERWLRVAADMSNHNLGFQQLLALFYAEEADSLAEGGISALEVMATVMPDDPEVQAALGWALYQSGRREAALEALDAVLERLPEHPRSLLYKAQIYLETGSLAEARALLERVAALDSPFRAEARRMLDGLGDAG